MDGTVRILFVDDEKNVLRSLERVFMDDEYEILTASSGVEGLSVLRREPSIRLVVSDFRMPGMNGVEFLKEVYKCWPKTVRMVLSGQADTSSIATAMKEGHIHKFITKPWDEDELKGAISDALEKFFGGIRNAA
jgi:two-component system NtrC family sensor kinase